MYKLSYYQSERPQGIAYDDTQKLPLGWRKLTNEEFSQNIIWIYSPRYIEYAQIYYDHEGNQLPHMHEVVMFHFHNETGLALESDHKGNVTAYAFGCRHITTEVSEGFARDGTKLTRMDRFDHIYKCDKCGYTYIVNSSD